MTDLEISENFQQSRTVRFKVIGIETGATEIIEKVRLLSSDEVDCFVVNSTSDCVPEEEDLMAIIVALDNEDIANAIAKPYHDAGVLTIGLLHNADFSCYDNIVKDTDNEFFPEVIKILLEPLVKTGYICFDFMDLCTTLRKGRFFKTLVSDGKSVEEAVLNMQKEMENVDVERIEILSALLYFNREKSLTMDDMSPISNLLASLPKSIDIIWSVNFDDTLPKDLIRMTVIMSDNKP